MARLTRQVGIRSAEVRLPGPSSAGPALVKTAATVADIAFNKQADKMTQKAQVAAAALNFERDGDGNLLPPALPLTEEGLLAPSIYDRAYTQMVGQRYVQQMKIDTHERIGLIATEHWDDPTAFKEVAEGYVKNVTDLAPDRLKHDVNMAAQVRMVEHFNHITRVKAERDHTAAKNVHLQSMQINMDELIGLYEAGGDPTQIASKRAEIVAQVAEGSFDGGFNYFTEDEAAEILASVELKSSLASVVGRINQVPDNPLAFARAVEDMIDFKEGDGFIDVVNDDGSVSRVNAAELYPNPADRADIADYATALLTQRARAFDNIQDERLNAKSKAFWDWYSPHALEALPVELGGNGTPIDRDRLFVEFDKAHFDVVTYGYDDTLREEIRQLIMQETMKGGRQLSKEEQAFQDDYASYSKMFGAEINRRLNGVEPKDLSAEEALRLHYGTLNDVGNVSSGNTQTAGNAGFIGKYYSGMAGKPLDQDYMNDLLERPTPEKIQEFKWLVDTEFSKIGLWPREWSNAIIGKLNDPEGMNQQTLENVTGLVRVLWDNPTFRHNMSDSNALGHGVGRTLDHLFWLGDQPTPAKMAETLNNFNDPNWSPRQAYNSRPPEEKEMFNTAMDKQIDKYFRGNAWTGFESRASQAPTFGFNPFDEDVVIPPEVKAAIEDRVVASAGFIDPDNPDTFFPFIREAAHTAMREKGYASTELGYSPLRHGQNYNYQFTTPDMAVTQFPPDYFAVDPNSGQKDHVLMEKMTENFQTVLDHYDRQMNNGFLADGSANPNWKPMFAAGVNAGLEFDADATHRLGTPTWNIRLVRVNGVDSDILTENGLLAGDPVRLNMIDARQRAEEEKAERFNRGIDATGRVRLDYQNGQAHGRRMHGSQQ